MPLAIRSTFANHVFDTIPLYPIEWAPRSMTYIVKTSSAPQHPRLEDGWRLWHVNANSLLREGDVVQELAIGG